MWKKLLAIGTILTAWLLFVQGSDAHYPYQQQVVVQRLVVPYVPTYSFTYAAPLLVAPVVYQQPAPIIVQQQDCVPQQVQQPPVRVVVQPQTVVYQQPQHVVYQQQQSVVYQQQQAQYYGALVLSATAYQPQIAAMHAHSLRFRDVSRVRTRGAAIEVRVQAPPQPPQRITESVRSRGPIASAILGNRTVTRTVVR